MAAREVAASTPSTSHHEHLAVVLIGDVGLVRGEIGDPRRAARPGDDLVEDRRDSEVDGAGTGERDANGVAEREVLIGRRARRHGDVAGRDRGEAAARHLEVVQPIEHRRVEAGDLRGRVADGDR